MLPWENLKFRSSKTAGNAPKTCILLIYTEPLFGHAPVFWYKKSYSTRLKLALHAQDLLEFCHTLETGDPIITYFNCIP